MTKHGSTIFVEVEEAAKELSALVAAVETEGRSVQICRGGKPVATIQQPVRDPLAVHADLKATHIADDAFAPLEEEDWPSDCR